MHDEYLKQKGHIRRCFNKAAATYDEHSYPQKMIGQQLIDLLLASQTEFNSVIDLGCGTGLVTEFLAKQICYQNFAAIDMSEELITTAQQRLAELSIQTQLQDFETFHEKAHLYDLIFSNMALHWGDLNRMLHIIFKQLKSRGLLGFSIPLEGTFSELHNKNKFQEFDLVKKYLIENGFKIKNALEKTFIFNFDSKLKAMRSIKDTGANHVLERQPIQLNKLRNNLLTKATLTYQIGFFIGECIVA